MPFNYTTTTYIRAWREAKRKEIANSENNVSSHEFGHIGHKGQCLCMCKMCWSDTKGCICKICSGVGHWSCLAAEHAEDNPCSAGLDKEAATL